MKINFLPAIKLNSGKRANLLPEVLSRPSSAAAEAERAFIAPGLMMVMARAALSPAEQQRQHRQTEQAKERAKIIPPAPARPQQPGKNPDHKNERKHVAPPERRWMTTVIRSGPDTKKDSRRGHCHSASLAISFVPVRACGRLTECKPAGCPAIGYSLAQIKNIIIRISNQGGFVSEFGNSVGLIKSRFPATIGTFSRSVPTGRNT